MSLPQPDLAILRKAQRGDERAFAIIVRAYETPVYNYVLRLTNGDKALAEDLTQEVFLRVFQGLPRFSLRCKFTTWLFQVTKNRVPLVVTDSGCTLREGGEIADLIPTALHLLGIDPAPEMTGAALVNPL